MTTNFDTLLRRTLFANALFSTLSALVCFSASSSLSGHLEFSSAEIVSLGVQLLVFAAALGFLGSRPTLGRGWVLAAVLFLGVADMLWVLGSALALREGLALTGLGQTIVVAVALVVGCFGVLQLVSVGMLLRQRRTVAVV